jgi:hypothetical protein
MNPDSLVVMPDAGNIIEPLAAVSPLLGVIATIAIIIVVFLYRENKKKDDQIATLNDTYNKDLTVLTDRYNQTQMQNLDTLKDVANIVDKSTESLERNEQSERDRQILITGKLDQILMGLQGRNN